MISGAWGLSCVMWVIPIYVWQYIEGSRIQDGECYVQFVETNRVMSILCSWSCMRGRGASSSQVLFQGRYTSTLCTGMSDLSSSS